MDDRSSKQPLDIARIAAGKRDETQFAIDVSSGAPDMTETGSVALTPPEQAWLDATQILQRNIISSLRSPELSWSERRTATRIRREAMQRVSTQYIEFLEKEAALSSEAALDARRTMLQRHLKEIKANILTEMADVLGLSIRQLEDVFAEHAAKIQTPAFQQLYAQFVTQKLEQLMSVD